MKWFTNFFKKLLKAIKKILAVILVIIAVILILWSALATGGATLALLGFTLTTTGAMIAGCVALVGAFLIDGKSAGKVVGKIGDAAGSAAGAVAGAVGSVAGGVATGVIGAILHNPVLLGIGLLTVGYFLLSDDGGSKQPKERRNPGDSGRDANFRNRQPNAVKREGVDKKASVDRSSPLGPPTPYGMKLEA